MDLFIKIIKKTTWLAVILVLLFFIIPSRPVSKMDYEFEGATVRKECISYMKTIQGAMELYCMEEMVSGEVRFETLRTLIEKKYLRRDLRCGRNKEKAYLVTNSPGNKVVDVECAVHGKLSEADTIGREKGLRKRNFFEKIFLDKTGAR